MPRLRNLNESPEQKEERRKQRRREVYKAFYERNKEAQQARVREAYDPERRKAYYDANREMICDRMRNYYKKKKATPIEERLETIATLCDDTPEFASAFRELKPNAANLTTREVSLLEDIIFNKTMKQMEYAPARPPTPVEPIPIPEETFEPLEELKPYLSVNM
jgi:hypothetical protein